MLAVASYMMMGQQYNIPFAPRAVAAVTAPVVIASAIDCCTAADTCPLTHGFTLVSGDFIFITCHNRINGTSTITSADSSVTGIFDETDASNASLAGGFFRSTGSGDAIVTCDGPGTSEEIAVAAIQIRGVVGSGDPESVVFVVDSGDQGFHECGPITPVDDHTIGICSIVHRRDFSAAPTDSAFDASASWSAFDFSDDAVCTVGGFAGQEIISDISPAAATPSSGNRFTAASQGQGVSVMVVLQP